MEPYNFKKEKISIYRSNEILKMNILTKALKEVIVSYDYNFENEINMELHNLKKEKFDISRNNEILKTNILIKALKEVIVSYDYTFENKIDIIFSGHEYPAFFIGSLLDGHIISVEVDTTKYTYRNENNQTIKIWNDKDGNILRTIYQGVDSILILKNDTIAISYLNKLYILYPNTGDIISILIIDNRHNKINKIFEVSNNNLILQIGSKYTDFSYLSYFDIDTKKITRLSTPNMIEILVKNNDIFNINNVSGLTDGRFIVSSSHNTVYIYDPKIGLDNPIISVLTPFLER